MDEIEREVSEIFEEFSNHNIITEDDLLQKVYGIDPDDPELTEKISHCISEIVDHPHKESVLEYIENQEELSKLFVHACLTALSGKKYELKKRPILEDYGKNY